MEKSSLKKKLIGDKKFYMMVLTIAIPIMIQNGVTNFVGLLDNIMIGAVGTEQMSGAAIVNQLLFVFNLCIFGGVSGAGIFTAQYYGQGDHEGVRQTFRFKFWMGILITIIACALFVLKGNALIGTYLKGGGSGVDAAATLEYGRRYLMIMLLGLPPFMMEQVYASTLRECGHTLTPMKAGIIAVFVNLVLNYLFIFGKLSLPAMGVAGAAVATVISRYIEFLIVMAWTHKHPEINTFVIGLYSTLKVPINTVRKIILKGTPLLLNETMWASGMAMLAQCYSVRGLNVVAALNICNTINNVFNIVFIALGDSVAIVVGQLLGAGKMKEARETDTKMIFFSVACCTAVATLMFILAPLFPKLYNTNNEVREIAKYLIMISAAFMPNGAFLHACYFTIRSGGKTGITFLFDSGFIWGISVVTAFMLGRFTALSVLWIYAFVQLGDGIKSIIGFVLVKKGIWLNNIVNEIN